MIAVTDAEKGINPLTLIRVAKGLLETSYDFVQQGDSGRRQAVLDLREAQERITRALGLLREEIANYTVRPEYKCP